ncbi:MAG: SufE family protein [Pseudomonadota bacterium]
MSVAIADIEQELIDEFSFFDNWMDRYQYLIDLGRQLPAYPEHERAEADKVAGCQSQVWMQASGDAEQMHFRAISDAAIVSGLIALLMRLYDGQSAQAIVDYEPQFVTGLGLDKHLSQNRANGLHAMMQRIRATAAHMSGDAAV